MRTPFPRFLQPDMYDGWRAYLSLAGLNLLSWAIGGAIYSVLYLLTWAGLALHTGGPVSGETRLTAASWAFLAPWALCVAYRNLPGLWRRLRRAKEG